ncbi:BNR repeat domain protein [hydrothermal vent metagenome]|uniref:BNR repeat domain protein n=1 Tax=hydrothermal vent metagenome TaxID=652676 RepID=A0A3B0ZUM8_9ZZZZ
MSENRVVDYFIIIIGALLLAACGGAKSENSTTIARPDPTIQIIASASYGNTSCAIKTFGDLSKGNLSCWGQFPDIVIIDEKTGLAERTFRNESSPVAMSTDANWTDVTIGQYHICGIKSLSSGERLYCMGWNDHGQLGLARLYYLDDFNNPERNTRNFYPTMTQVGSSTDWKKLYAAGEHTCGIFGAGDLIGTGELKCWGLNNDGVLAQNTENNVYDDLDSQNQTNLIRRVLSSDSTPVIATWISVSTSDNHTCAIQQADNSLWCWGLNTDLQLGLPSNSAIIQKYVTAVTLPNVGFDPTTEAWIGVSAGLEHTCAISAAKTGTTISTSGKLWCWGSNQFGEIGVSGTTSSISLPNSSPVNGSRNWKSVSVGQSKTCAINDLGEAFCFGYNASVPFINDRYPITAVAGRNENWTSITVGLGHECGVKTVAISGVDKSQLYCWGQQQFSQLAGGFNYNSYIPNLISNDENILVDPYVWKSLAAGGHHSCALKNDNSLWCWGKNFWGQLGVGNEFPASTLKKVTSEIGWTDVDSYFKTTCALKTDGSMWCWSQNHKGQLGTGSILFENIPTITNNNISDWNKIAIGQYHSCGLKNNNSLWCWGSATFGQLGPAMAIPDTTTAIPYSTVKLQVPGDWKTGKVFSGKYNTCAIEKIANNTTNPDKTVEDLYCWGRNKYNEINISVNLEVNTPSVIPKPENTLQWISASIGKRYICALANTDITATQGSLWCWGDNYLGVIGNKTHYDSIDFTSNASYEASRFIPFNTPFNVNTPNTAAGEKTMWRQVSAHDENVCAIKNDGTLWCWGENAFGEIGRGDVVLSAEPAQEATKSPNWVEVQVGDNHACGLQSQNGKTDFSLWCWGGRSFERQIGDLRLVNLEPKLIL